MLSKKWYACKYIDSSFFPFQCPEPIMDNVTILHKHLFVSYSFQFHTFILWRHSSTSISSLSVLLFTSIQSNIFFVFYSSTQTMWSVNILYSFIYLIIRLLVSVFNYTLSSLPLPLIMIKRYPNNSPLIFFFKNL